MAKKETIHEPKDVVEPIPEEVAKLEEGKAELAEAEKVLEELEAPVERRLTREEMDERNKKEALAAWVPKTQLGKDVRSGKEKDLDKILSSGKKILEAEVVDLLIHPKTDLLLIGQSKGKFGGGKRRAWKQTQKKTMEGNVVTFACTAVVGDMKGHVGIGYGKAKETLPSRDKSIRMAKLNVIKITRGFETPEPGSNDPHTVPFVVEGKCGSVRIKLIPAPRGTGLVIGNECKKILKLAGIKDVYSRATGQTRTTINMGKACVDALSKTNKEMIK